MLGSSAPHPPNLSFPVFALLLSDLSKLGFPFPGKESVCLSVCFIRTLHPDDRPLSGVDAHKDSSALSLFLLLPFSIDGIFLRVYLDCFVNLLAFVVCSENLNFVILPDGHRSNFLLLSQFCVKRGDMLFFD